MTPHPVLIDGEPGGYGVTFPDLPGCTAMGRTPEEALANAGEAVRDWALGVEARGGRVPEPRTPGAVRADPEVLGALGEGAMLANVPLVRGAGP